MQNTEEEQFAHETTPAAPAAQTRYLSSPAAATLHGKTQGFVLRLPPQNRALATSCSHRNAICNHSFKNRIELRTQEQPLVAKHIGGTIRAWNDPSRTRRTDEVPFIAGCSHFTRKNTRFRAPASSPKHSPCNIHAAIPMRSCNHSFKNRIELRTQEQPLVAKHIGGTIRAWNDPSRTRRTDEVPFFGGCSHFTRKNTRFRAPASSPKHNPCNIHAAIPMRSCNHSFKNRIELRTQEQPLVAKHIGGTIRAWNDPSRTRRTDEVPFIAGCSHFTRKHKVSCSGFLPKTKPMQHACSHYNAISNHSFRKRIELRTQEQPLLQNT